MNTGQQPENYRNIDYYRDCQVYKNTKKSGDALNQPILLLSVIDLIAQGLIQDNRILIADELIEAFKKNWAVLGSGSFKGSDFALPFFHLKNAKGEFWYLKFSAEYGGGRPQSIPKLRRDVDFARLDEELFELLREPNSRKELVDSFIATWFSSSQREVEEILQIDQDFQDSTWDELDRQEESDGQDTKTPKFYLIKSIIREGIFRKKVVHLYDYRCAVCRLRVTRTLNQSIVDGAHIKPFSKFYECKINNGISLCKNHHWAFDRGWFSLDDCYKIIVAGDLEEESPNSRPMKDYQGEIILLPNSEKFYPRVEALQWHRTNVFRV
ncbi:HNH endonuclease [Microseira wollei]|uniref:HNH endonuclease family protein n=1 Tax=Microseira wollei NIES-4236 TaxID=2530354 RepID=A0AAV3XHU3_9CYAN|nr:HNH endonuclease [Microseira wollei]GET42497.1 HNH endonuclease family protein [Microseira wollei NIES-4236]